MKQIELYKTCVGVQKQDVVREAFFLPFALRGTIASGGKTLFVWKIYPKNEKK